MRFPLRVPEEAMRGARERLRSLGIGDYVVVNPGGGWRSKCWPAERYGVLCDLLWRRHGLRAVINVGPGEAPLAASLTEAAGGAAPVTVDPSLPELAALLAQARLVVAADTGPLHLAAALGTRVLALFGPTDPARNGPIPSGAVVRNPSNEAFTHSRGEEYSPTMLSISVEQVLAEAEREMSVNA